MVNWNLALDPAGKPANGGCGNSTDGVCTGVVTIDGTTVTRDAEYWQFRPTSGGYYQVVSRHAPTLVWDVAGGPGAAGDGTDIHLWSYVGGTNQQWQPVALGGGSYRFVARNSGKCLDVRDVSTADGARLQQWTCTGGPAQSFRLTG